MQIANWVKDQRMGLEEGGKRVFFLVFVCHSLLFVEEGNVNYFAGGGKERTKMHK